MRIIKLGILLVNIFLLSGCLSPVSTDRNCTYFIKCIPHCIPQKKPHPLTLLVLPSETQPAYNTTQIAYSLRPFQIAYFSRNQWAETPSQMLLPLMVQTLQCTHYFHAVVTPPFMGRYNYLLNTQIITLQQNFYRCPHVVELNARVQLSRSDTNRIVATRQFCIIVPIPCKTPYCGVMATNRAASIFLSELAKFTVQHAN